MPFPDKYYRSSGYTVHGFSFKLKHAAPTISSILNPTRYLINAESGIVKIDNTLTDELFNQLKEKIDEYDAIPTKNFINESFFLYDKSNLIKRTFVTAINKQLSLFGSFSYFSWKTGIKKLKLLSTDNFLKFFTEKKSLRWNINLQLTQVNRSKIKTSDNKIHDFSITKLGKRKKRDMSKLIETLIIRAQQNFDIEDGINPIQIEIKDDRVTTILKK